MSTPFPTEHPGHLRLRRLGIDTYQEPVLYMHRDCPVCHSEGFEAQSRVELTLEGRRFLEEAFAAEGLEYVPSFANFVLVKVGHGKAVFKALLQKGIIVRDMDAYDLPEWVRVSVGTMEQNRRFLEELRQVLAPAAALA